MFHLFIYFNKYLALCEYQKWKEQEKNKFCQVWSLWNLMAVCLLWKKLLDSWWKPAHSIELTWHSKQHEMFSGTFMCAFFTVESQPISCTNIVTWYTWRVNRVRGCGRPRGCTFFDRPQNALRQKVRLLNDWNDWGVIATKGITSDHRYELSWLQLGMYLSSRRGRRNFNRARYLFSSTHQTSCPT